MKTNLSLPTLLAILLAPLLVLSGCSDSPQFDRIGAAVSLARTIAAEQDHVSVEQLSDWIIRDQRDFELVDIREQADFDAGHIEGARHQPLGGLMSDASLDALPAGRKIVVYSNGTAHAAQAALLLRLIDREAYALLGGFNHWQAYLNDPQLAGTAEMDPVRRAEYQAVSCFFEGDYVAKAGLTPKVVAGTSGPAAGSAAPASAGDSLGLGLGLGSEEVRASKPATAPAADPLGLGLGLGLGNEEIQSIQQAAPPPKPSTGRLLIKAEC